MPPLQSPPPPRRTWALAAFLLLFLHAQPVFADVGKGFGIDKVFGVSGAYGFGSRFGESGKSGVVRAEGAAYFMTTPFDNRGGMEGGLEMGYDGFKNHDPSALLGGFLWDLWLGFPITVYEKGDENGPWLSTALIPGLGASNLHGYVYLKGKVVAKVADKVAVELTYQWTPYSGSDPFMGSTTDDHAGIAMGTLRLTAYFALNNDISLYPYIDWRQSNLDEPKPGSDPALSAFSGSQYSSTSFAPITRTRMDNNYRVGLGVAF
jgi:hypothetical protein